MPYAIPEFKKKIIKIKIELKQHDKTIAKDTSMFERSIRAYKKNMRDHGILCPSKAVSVLRASSQITPDMQEVRVNIYRRLLSKADH